MKNYNSKLKIIKNFYFLIVIFIFSFLFFNFNVARAAILYLDSSDTEYQTGDIFSATIRIDNEDECVNAVEVNLKFPKDILEAVDFQDGESILVFWVKRPEIKNDEGMISFIGGIPGGYCGKLRDNSGFTNILGKIIFKIRGTDAEQTRGIDAELEFLDSKVLVNDGVGTEAVVATKNLEFRIQNLGRDKSVDTESYIPYSFDIEPPEPFAVELTKDILPQEKRNFAVFSTTDKQSGIDHFEILEADSFELERQTEWGMEWKIAQDPYYLLEDQDLGSIIKVKAVDKAGNERVVEYGFVNACSTLMLV